MSRSTSLLALVGLLACNDPGKVDSGDPVPTDDSDDTSETADTNDTSTELTGVDLVVNALALDTCEPYLPMTPSGLSTQTPDNVTVGLLGVYLLDGHSAKAPVPLLVSPTPLALNLSSGAEIVRVDTSAIPEGSYTWLAFDLAWGSFTVQATAHDYVTVGGNLTFDVALASYTNDAGYDRDQGDVEVTFEAYGTEVSYPVSTTISCPLSSSGGHPDPADGAFRVRTPIPSGAVILSHASKTEISLEVDFPMANSFTWAEKTGTDYVDGTYDLAMDMAATETPESLPICGLFLADRCMEGAPTARPWPPGPMPDSTTLYCADDSETLDPCPIPGDPTWGQDGNYLVNTPSWVLGADTVLDQVTGLLWERGHSPETQDWWGSLDYCAELVLDGREDWTLPSRNELLSILDLGTYNPTIDAEAFPDTPATFFWSSSPLPYSALAYGVRFEQGYMYDHDPASSGYARCVTQTTPSEGTRWELADETATDLRTGLVWQRNITSDALSWSGALQACESLVLAGASDWRLPTQKEQETIIDETRWGPSADRVAFPGQPAEWFWNSTPAADAPGYSWAASFTNGYMTPAANGERYRVQCVR